MFDEYTPADLPRYSAPLRLIDCGAYTGVAIEKFLRAGYAIERVAAFEPDLTNFEKLVTKAWPIEQCTLLPLGTWSSHSQLRFSSNGSMGSSLSTEGDTVIQCVKLDDVLHGFAPNLIKMDVEGAEIETLKGMRNIIEKYKPNLCLSAYHTPQHLFEIPLLIKSWNLGYKFYLRVHEYNTFGVVVYCLQDQRLDKQHPLGG